MLKVFVPGLLAAVLLVSSVATFVHLTPYGSPHPPFPFLAVLSHLSLYPPSSLLHTGGTAAAV